MEELFIDNDDNKAVWTREQWKTVLAKNILEWQSLQGQDDSTLMRRSMKAQEIGQQCCQAGEYLGDLDLLWLKRTIGLTEWEWRRYKSRIRPEPE